MGRAGIQCKCKPCVEPGFNANASLASLLLAGWSQCTTPGKENKQSQSKRTLGNGESKARRSAKQIRSISNRRELTVADAAEFYCRDDRRLFFPYARTDSLLPRVPSAGWSTIYSYSSRSNVLAASRLCRWPVLSCLHDY
jgi:hypothetical protein